MEPEPESKAQGLEAFEDPNNSGNGALYHTGKPCVERGCARPAGTAWSPYWCFEHNVERIRRIDKQLQTICGGKYPGERP